MINPLPSFLFFGKRKKDIPMKNILLVSLSVVGAFALIAGIALATGLFRLETAAFFGNVDAQVQIESGPSRIAKYEEFFETCSAVRSVEAQLDAQKTLLASLDPTHDQYARTMTNIAGLSARRATHIETYNRLAAQEETTARFQADNLPSRLSDAAYDGTKTACEQ